MTHEIIDRKMARAMGLKTFFTGTPCCRGHISERRVSCKQCIECSKYHHSIRAKRSRESRQQYSKMYYKKHRELILRRSAEQKRADKSEYMNNYRDQNRDRIREQTRALYVRRAIALKVLQSLGVNIQP